MKPRFFAYGERYYVLRFFKLRRRFSKASSTEYSNHLKLGFDYPNIYLTAVSDLLPSFSACYMECRMCCITAVGCECPWIRQQPMEIRNNHTIVAAISWAKFYDRDLSSHGCYVVCMDMSV